jgi:hypothetical protein
MNATKSNQRVYNKYMITAQNMKSTAFAFNLAGGACFGGALGYILGSVINRNGQNINGKVLFPLLGGGICFIALGITFHTSANDKIKAGVKLYNHLKAAQI